MGRRWTLETAEAMLGEVRLRTQRAVAAVDALGPGLPIADRAGAEDPERPDPSAEAVRRHVSRWLREMEALGVEVLGPWRVEFACDGGAFCWAWPDSRLRFRARDSKEATPIQ